MTRARPDPPPFSFGETATVSPPRRRQLVLQQRDVRRRRRFPPQCRSSCRRRAARAAGPVGGARARVSRCRRRRKHLPGGISCIAPTNRAVETVIVRQWASAYTASADVSSVIALSLSLSSRASIFHFSFSFSPSPRSTPGFGVGLAALITILYYNILVY